MLPRLARLSFIVNPNCAVLEFSWRQALEIDSLDLKVHFDGLHCFRPLLVSHDSGLDQKRASPGKATTPIFYTIIQRLASDEKHG
jgi:hypothetical protein